MNARVVHIASNTFREAVRDRVLYNLIAFALLLSGAAILVGQISIDIEKLVVIQSGPYRSFFVWDCNCDIHRHWTGFQRDRKANALHGFIAARCAGGNSSSASSWAGGHAGGEYVLHGRRRVCGLFYVSHKFVRADALILVALYFIILEFLIICSLALLFSSFSSPLLSAVFCVLAVCDLEVSPRTCGGFAGMATDLRAGW